MLWIFSGENLSRLLYFYLPLCIIWAINVLLFVLTIRRIIQLQHELKVMLKNESARHQRKLNKDKEKYAQKYWLELIEQSQRIIYSFHLHLLFLFLFLFRYLFSFLMYLRLSMLMGITWVMEGISYFTSQGSPYFLLTDIWNCAQGVLIFVLFVLKRRVFKLIRKRWNCCMDEQQVAAIADDVRTRETTFAWRSYIFFAPATIVVVVAAFQNQHPNRTSQFYLVSFFVQCTISWCVCVRLSKDQIFVLFHTYN